MCTATWHSDGSQLELLFNRDEQRSRLPAQSPRVHQQGASRFLAPVDGNAGGTWIAAGEQGLVLALLNRYQDDVATCTEAPRSRGLLVMDLAEAQRPQAVLERLANMDLRVYRPFTLLVGDTTGCVPVAWSGARCWSEDHSPTGFLSSSSFAGAEVIAGRYELWRTWQEEPLAYHRSHRPQQGPYSVCMHRPDAQTVSLTRVRLAARDLSMEYAPGPPCRTSIQPALSLRCRTAAR